MTPVPEIRRWPEHVKILLLALWGIILMIPFRCLMMFLEFLEPFYRPPIWVATPVVAIMWVIYWGWFAPALCVTTLLGIVELIYDLEILPCPRNAIGWLLPVACWYLILSVASKWKKRKKQSEISS